MARATLQWWEVARGWRLGRRIEIGLLRFDWPARCQVIRVSRRGRRRQSQALVFLAPRRMLRRSRLISSWSVVPSRHSLEDPASTIDEKPALLSAGLTGQVESRRPCPPSSLVKSPRNLDDSRAVCPISPNLRW